MNKVDCRIPQNRPRTPVSHWLVEVVETGELIIVLNKTFSEMSRQMNREYSTHGWELHDREDTGELVLVDLAV